MRRLLALIPALVLAGCTAQREAGETSAGTGDAPPAETVREDVPPSVPAAEEPPTPAGPVQDVSPFSAVLVFETELAVRARVEYGVPGLLGLFSAPDPFPTRSHRIRLDGLSPERSWDYRVFVDGAQTLSGTFDTVSLPDRSLRAGVTDGRLEVDGHPFFPIMQIAQCPSDYPTNRALGVDVFVGRQKHCDIDDEELVDAAQAAGGLAVVHFEDGIQGRPGLLGYTLTDEPDALGLPPADVAAERDEAHAGDPDHPIFVTLSPSLHREFEARWSGAERDAVYRTYANAADVVGVDLYPHWTLCDESYLPAVAAVQRVLSSYARGPTFQWIEAAAANNTACTGARATPVSADEMRAEVWMAVTNGATGIGYFTHTWVNGHVAFDVEPPLREAKRETNEELNGLAPALFGQTLDVAVSVPGVDAIARIRNGALYVFAVNETREEKQVRFALAPGGRAVLNWRTGAALAVDPEGFADTLAPLASAIYVLPPVPSGG